MWLKTKGSHTTNLKFKLSLPFKKDDANNTHSKYIVDQNANWIYTNQASQHEFFTPISFDNTTWKLLSVYFLHYDSKDKSLASLQDKSSNDNIINQTSKIFFHEGYETLPRKLELNFEAFYDPSSTLKEDCPSIIQENFFFDPRIEEINLP